MHTGASRQYFVMRCHGLVRHVDNLKILVLSQSWLARASSQAVMTNDLVLCSGYPGCTKLNTKARNQTTSQPTAIVVVTDWATKKKYVSGQ